jgi:hypothetical protein
MFLLVYVSARKPSVLRQSCRAGSNIETRAAYTPDTKIKAPMTAGRQAHPGGELKAC